MAVYSRVYRNENKGDWYHDVKVGEISSPVDRSKPHAFGSEKWWLRVNDSLYPTSNPQAVVGDAYQAIAWEWDNGFGRLDAQCYDNILRAASGGKRAAAAITLYEWKSTLGMISSTAGKLANSAKALRKGDIYNALRHLNVSDPKRAQKMTKQYGDGRRLDRLWLEINFGWAPLISDIRQMCAVMSQEVPIGKISSRSRGAIDRFTRTDGSWGYMESYARGTKQLQYTSKVIAVNPNVLLAKQLGLTNPLQVAWDAVPMSFVIDWFLPVNKYLSSLDMSLGITLDSLVISKKVEAEGASKGHIVYSPSEIRDFSNPSYAFQFRRSISALPPLPSFRDRMAIPTGSLWQAATTAALALTQLTAIKANSRI